MPGTSVAPFDEKGPILVVLTAIVDAAAITGAKLKSNARLLEIEQKH